MSFEELSHALRGHEKASQQRFETLCEHIHETKEHSMSTPEVRNIFETGGMGGAGAGLGAGLGGGLLGGILGGALLGNNGILGNRHGGYGGDVVTPMQLQTATGSIIDANQNTAVLQGLGDIKAAVPLAEAQVQLAIAQAQAGITQTLGQTENALLLGQTAINKNVTDAIAASLASQNNINVNVLTQGSATREAVASYGVANLTATKDAQFATQVAISNSTKEILAALNDQNTANLQRQLTVAEQALLEQRAEGRARGTEVNVTQTVNQNQMQLQAQQQQQQQAILLNNLCQHVMGLQNAVATNSNLIIGNTGATTTGPQTANPVNVRA